MLSSLRRQDSWPLLGSHQPQEMSALCWRDWQRLGYLRAGAGLMPDIATVTPKMQFRHKWASTSVSTRAGNHMALPLRSCSLSLQPYVLNALSPISQVGTQKLQRFREMAHVPWLPSGFPGMADTV